MQKTHFWQIVKQIMFSKSEFSHFIKKPFKSLWSYLAKFKIKIVLEIGWNGDNIPSSLFPWSLSFIASNWICKKKVSEREKGGKAGSKGGGEGGWGLKAERGGGWNRKGLIHFFFCPRLNLFWLSLEIMISFKIVLQAEIFKGDFKQKVQQIRRVN